MKSLTYITLFIAAYSLQVFAGDKFEQDRTAILQMAGQFEVTFSFEETLALRKGYELTKPYNESAHELVEVVADTGKSITLQHLLVVQPEPKEGEEKSEDPIVVKHWSQTWKYEDADILDYLSKRSWKSYSLPEEEVAGTWTQFVTQVDDSPRYEGYGTWEHKGGRSIWISNLTNRPLPRREYTKRKDYDIVECVNRNVVSASGWAHEQNNAKLVQREDAPVEYIAHEIGLNTYTRVKDYDFSPALDYWGTYAKYWEQVRQVWEELYSEKGVVKLARFTNDETLREMIYDAVEISEEKGLTKIPDLKEKILQFFVK